mgnify:FL=1|jgi:hypothetical protein|tara:strand:- start:7510 stop:7965 length:456 start_codon:yes stop_codon:yes gene_type:complete
MDNQQNIKLVRLQSGEDVIADITSDSDSTILNNPMVLMVRRSPKGSVMMMVPWLPIEIISDNMATLNNREIVTFTNPKNSLIEYYLNAIKTVADEALHSEGILEEFNLKNVNQATDDLLASREIEEYYDDDTSVMDEYLNKMNKPDKSKLH